MPGQSLAEGIAAQLEARIADGEWEPGQKLPSERELCDAFGASRPIIRQALQTLRHRGVADIQPNRGAFVAAKRLDSAVRAIEYSLRGQKLSFNSLLEGRVFLETRIAELAAINRTETDLTTLGSHLEGMEKSRVSDIPGFEAADLAFHLSLASASQNSLFLIWLQPITTLLRQTRLGIGALGRVRQKALASHRRILKEVAEQSPDSAREAMYLHLQDFAADTKRAIKLGILPPETTGVAKPQRGLEILSEAAENER